MDRSRFRGVDEGQGIMVVLVSHLLSARRQVYVAAICGHVPGDMVRCISEFINCCYIVRRNAITTSDIARIRAHLAKFHQLRQIFITVGIRKDFSLPQQHALMHYATSIELFGSPNGTCTSQTEAKHKSAVKEPWRRSNRNKPLNQMTKTLTRMDKLQALRSVFKGRGMLIGALADYMAQEFAGVLPAILPWNGSFIDADDTDSDVSDHANSNDDSSSHDIEPVSGPRTVTQIWLAARYRMS
jgi:hypothetical protein